MPKSRSLKTLLEGPEFSSVAIMSDIIEAVTEGARAGRDAQEIVAEDLRHSRGPIGPREPGSERSFEFTGPQGTRFSDRPEPREDEERRD
jgi:hypothetical protein